MHDFRKLEVWRLADDLAVALYEDTRTFPPEERYGLSAQIRGAASSIVFNLAEGASLPSPGDFRRFVGIACGSAGELAAQIHLATRLRFLPSPRVRQRQQQTERIRRLLRGLYRSLL